MRRIVPLALVALTAATGACASAGSGGSGGSSDVITQEQLAENADMSAYEVVRRLRPQWLRARGGQTGVSGGTVERTGPGDVNPANERGTPGVIRDGVRISSDVGFLERISASELQEIRFLDSREATTRYGTGFPWGAIEIITAR